LNNWKEINLMEIFYFIVGWSLSLAGLYAVHKLLIVAEKHEK
jgi:hypothetical protein